MGLQYDPKVAVAVLAKVDESLAELIRRVGPFTLQVRPIDTPFQALLRAIIYQQLSGIAAAAIHDRMLARFHGLPPTPQQILDTPDEQLREAGVSLAKVAAIKDLAAKTLDGIVPSLEEMQGMDDTEIMHRLIAVRGIGRWTVEMLLIFHLGRPDVLPTSDLGIRKGFMLTYGLDALPSPAAIQTHGGRWRPYRSVASWYLWRAVELEDRTATGGDW
ncbi:MAG: DNA-3-methyladenine glycosylase 2 family protein [Pseudomonadota bacterium]|nr:DNA-3-methyladenine glycosylase 2 family protein [Pseudomonadota bacterium]